MPESRAGVKLAGAVDMFPAILPDETLMVDDAKEPEAGDVVLFADAAGGNTAHRLFHKFGGYFFTRSDNNRVFDLPVQRRHMLGVVEGKHINLRRNLALNMMLNAFLLYFIFYRIIFGRRDRVRFALLDAISIFFSTPEAEYYPSGQGDDSLNMIVFGRTEGIRRSTYNCGKALMNRIVLNTPFLFEGEYLGTYLEKFAQREMTVSEFRKIKRALDDEGIRHLIIKGLSYPYVRDICDVDLVFDDLDGAGRVLSGLGYVSLRESGIEVDFGKKFKDFDVIVDAHKKLPGIHYGVEYPLKKKLMLDSYERLLLCCAHTYQERRLILRDLIDLEYLLRSVDLDGIRIRERGVYEILGVPLITLHLFDRGYNGGSNKALADFVMRWYPKQVKTMADLLGRRNYDLPLYYLNFYVETKLFGIHKFLKPPVFYSTESKKYFPFTPLIWLVTRVKGFMLMRYSTRPLADIEDTVS